MPKQSIIGGLSGSELETVQKILAQAEHLKRAQIFGSRAMNTHRPTSDVDLALFGDKLTRSDVNSLKIAFEDSTLPYTFDLIQHETIKEPELLAHIQRRGVDVFRKGFYLSEEGEWVPDGWNLILLGEKCDEITVGFVGSMAEHYVLEGIPFLRSKNIEPFKINYSDLCHISEEFHQTLKKSELHPGDIAVVRTGKPGAAVLIPPNLGTANCSDLVIIRCGDELHREFIVYFLNSAAKGFIFSALVGAVQQHFNVGEAKKLPIPLPPLAEQKAIAAVLGGLDDKIELLREQNETLEALAQTLFKRWFIDFNFPDENGNPYKDSGGKMEASELGEIPEGWKADKLDDYISISGGGTPSTKEPSFWDGEIAWSSPKDLSDRPDAFLLETNKTITTEGLGTISSGLNPVGSLLLSSRAPIGYIAFADIPVAVNQGYIVFAPEQNLSNQFMFLWLKKYMSAVTNAANGSTFLEISKKAFKEIETIIPNEGVLQDFQNLINPLFEKLKNNLIQIRTLTQLRDTLLPKLMKGEIRLTA